MILRFSHYAISVWGGELAFEFVVRLNIFSVECVIAVGSG